MSVLLPDTCPLRILNIYIFTGSNRIGWEDLAIVIYLPGKTCNLVAVFLERYRTTQKNHWDTSYSF